MASTRLSSAGVGISASLPIIAFAVMLRLLVGIGAHSPSQSRGMSDCNDHGKASPYVAWEAQLDRQFSRSENASAVSIGHLGGHPAMRSPVTNIIANIRRSEHCRRWYHVLRHRPDCKESCGALDNFLERTSSNDRRSNQVASTFGRARRSVDHDVRAHASAACSKRRLPHSTSARMAGRMATPSSVGA